MTDIAAWADRVQAARRERRVLTPPSAAEPGMGLDEAYGVNWELHRRVLQTGWRQGGRKIGLTNRAGWAALGARDILWAPIYREGIRPAGEVPLGGLVAPKVETEVVFGLKASVEDADPSEQTLLDAIEWMALGYEIVDCHYPDWRFKPVDAAVDYFFHVALVVGERRSVEDAQGLPEQLRTFRGTLRKNGAVALEGSGADVLGSPLEALAALVRLLARQGQQPLQAGEVVTTGAVTAPHPIAPGDELHASVQGLALPDLRVTCTAQPAPLPNA